MTDRAQYQAWLQAALDAGLPTHTLDHVGVACANGEAQLWVDERAIVVTQVDEHPTGLRTLSYWLAGGNLDAVLAQTGRIERFAREMGCGAIEIRGRRGWAPSVKALGFEPAGTYFVKRLDGGHGQEQHDD